MTTQEKQIKVAEIMGWTHIYWKPFRGGICDDGPPCGLYGNPNTDVYPEQLVPPFAESIDAIRAAVLAQSEEFQREFDSLIVGRTWITRSKGKPFHQLSAEDWCDAFLAAHDASKGNGVSELYRQ